LYVSAILSIPAGVHEKRKNRRHARNAWWAKFTAAAFAPAGLSSTRDYIVENLEQEGASAPEGLVRIVGIETDEPMAHLDGGEAETGPGTGGPPNQGRLICQQSETFDKDDLYEALVVGFIHT
jgi:hypothetical protein